MWSRYLVPNKLSEALELLEQFPDQARIVAGGTDLVLDFSSSRHPVVEALIDISCIPELKKITVQDDLIHIGSAVTLSQILKSDVLQAHVPVLVESVRAIAGPQIRNIGTIGGNVVNASPAADTIPALLVLNSVLSIAGPGGRVRNIPLCEFLLGNRKVDLRPNEIVTGMYFPIPPSSSRQYFRKVQPRQSMAIAMLNLAIMLLIDDRRITDARIAMGAVAPTAVRMKTIEQELKNLPVGSSIEPLLYEGVREDIAPISDFRASLAYRLEVAGQLLQESIISLLQSDIEQTHGVHP